MKSLRAPSGPFRERPFYTDRDFERICDEALRETGLFPPRPEPVRIERFIEKRFGVQPRYENLPTGVLGYTEFGPKGPQAVYVSRTLSEERTKIAERRINSTLAHEGGHGLLHAHLFILESAKTMVLFDHDRDVEKSKILCRHTVDREHAGYDGRWWELQANRAMGCLLLPRQLVLQSLEDLLSDRGTIGTGILKELQRPDAIRRLSDTFDVSAQVAGYRLEALLPRGGHQLAL